MTPVETAVSHAEAEQHFIELVEQLIKVPAVEKLCRAALVIICLMAVVALGIRLAIIFS